MTTLQPQFRVKRWTFLLDGRVVEILHEGTVTSTRIHVDHLAVEVRPDADGMTVTWGVDIGGHVRNGGRATVPSVDIPAFQAFIAAATANRATK